MRNLNLETRNPKRETYSIVATGILLLVAVIVPNVVAQKRIINVTSDEAAIKQVLARYVETWNKNDMKAWGQLFTDDVDYINRGGGWWKSNKENVEGHQMIHDMLVKQQQKMTYKSSVAKISFLKPDIALVHSWWEWPDFIQPPGEKANDFKGVITMVMVKKDGKWLIRALQNTITK